MDDNHCAAPLVTDFDTIDCALPEGHAGAHLDSGWITVR